jgi:NAD(P)H-quinone oxidoreductase subunit I
MTTATDPQNPAKPVVAKFEVDTGYCIFCGLCVASCPYKALFMGYSYEGARYRRSELLKSKEDLLLAEDKKISAFMHPDKEADLPAQTLLVEKKTTLR